MNECKCDLLACPKCVLRSLSESEILASGSWKQFFGLQEDEDEV